MMFPRLQRWAQIKQQPIFGQTSYFSEIWEVRQRSKDFIRVVKRVKWLKGLLEKSQAFRNPGCMKNSSAGKWINENQNQENEISSISVSRNRNCDSAWNYYEELKSMPSAQNLQLMHRITNKSVALWVNKYVGC